MLSQMVLKVLSVSMSLSTGAIGNYFLINITEEEEFGNKKYLFSNVFRSLEFFFVIKVDFEFLRDFTFLQIFFTDSPDKILLLFDFFNSKS